MRILPLFPAMLPVDDSTLPLDVIRTSNNACIKCDNIFSSTFLFQSVSKNFFLSYLSLTECCLYLFIFHTLTCCRFIFVLLEIICKNILTIYHVRISPSTWNFIVVFDFLLSDNLLQLLRNNFAGINFYDFLFYYNKFRLFLILLKHFVRYIFVYISFVRYFLN